jgi:uncharacterized integral membrane protein (TIGR00698 family)
MRTLAPGLTLALAVAIAAVLLQDAVAAMTTRWMGARWSPPAMIVALLFGMALHRAASQNLIQPGLTWCVRRLLRIAIALLGLRVAFADLVSLGPAVAGLVACSMAATVAISIAAARILGLPAQVGALCGSANAVCGASAALATSTVLPEYPAKAADTIFAVVMANFVSTWAMLAYPLVGLWLGFGPADTGVLIGATIQDMAQVVGAGYAVSEATGNAATIVKLFRVFLLLPVVLAIGWWFAVRGAGAATATVPTPWFAVAFVALAGLNSAAMACPAIHFAYLPAVALANELSTLGLLVSIAALGLATSMTVVFGIGWRHLVLFLWATVSILGLVIAGLLASS